MCVSCIYLLISTPLPFTAVGPSGGGKTLAKHVLLEAQRRLDPALNPQGGNPNYKAHKQYVLNPKAVTMGQLYGGSYIYICIYI